VDCCGPGAAAISLSAGSLLWAGRFTDVAVSFCDKVEVRLRDLANHRLLSRLFTSLSRLVVLIQGWWTVAVPVSPQSACQLDRCYGRVGSRMWRSAFVTKSKSDCVIWPITVFSANCLRVCHALDGVPLGTRTVSPVMHRSTLGLSCVHRCQKGHVKAHDVAPDYGHD